MNSVDWTRRMPCEEKPTSRRKTYNNTKIPHGKKIYFTSNDDVLRVADDAANICEQADDGDDVVRRHSGDDYEMASSASVQPQSDHVQIMNRELILNRSHERTATVGYKAAKQNFSDNKLQNDNIGFQMLQNLGWTGTSGLGKHSDGMQEPVRFVSFFFQIEK